MTSTTFEMGLALARISRNAPPEFVGSKFIGNKFPTPCNRAMAGLPGVRKSPSAISSFGRRWDSAHRCGIPGVYSPGGGPGRVCAKLYHEEKSLSNLCYDW